MNSIHNINIFDGRTDQLTLILLYRVAVDTRVICRAEETLLFFLPCRKDAGHLSNDAEHNLVRPAADAPQPEVAVEAADQDVLSEAHPAPVL